MTSGGIDWLCHSCGRTIAPTIIWGAQERATFNHFAGNLDIGHCWIITLLSIGSSTDSSATACLLCRTMRGVPVTSPFPNVADHVKQSITIRWKLTNWRSSLVTIQHQVLPRELALPSVRHLSSIW